MNENNCEEFTDEMERLLVNCCRGAEELNAYKDHVEQFEQINNDLHNEEYRLMNEFYEKQLKAMGVDGLESVPSDLMDKIYEVVDLSMLLECKDASPASVNNAWIRVEAELAQLRHKCEYMEAQSKYFERKTAQAETRLEELETHVGELEGRRELSIAKTNEWSDNIDLLQRKKCEYSVRLDSMKAEVDKLELKGKGIDLKSLLQLESEVQQLEKEYQSKLKQLEAFKDLPPDLTLARIKVGQGRDELKALEKQRDEYLKNISNAIV